MAKTQIPKILIAALLITATLSEKVTPLNQRFQDINGLRLTSSLPNRRCYYRDILIMKLKARSSSLVSHSPIRVKDSSNPKGFCKSLFEEFDSCCKISELESFVNSRITQARTQFQQFIDQINFFQAAFAGKEGPIYSKLQYMQGFLSSNTRKGNSETRGAMSYFSTMSPKIFMFLEKKNFETMERNFNRNAQKCFNTFVKQQASSYCYMCSARNRDF